MSTVPPVTTPSVNAVSAIAQSSLWNTRSVVVLIGVAGLLLYFLFDMFTAETKKTTLPPEPKPDLSKRLITQLFPGAANEKMLLDRPQYAAGIIRITLADINHSLNLSDGPIFVRCYHQDKWFFQQPLTQQTNSDFLEVFIPELPLNEEIAIVFRQNSNNYKTVRLKVDQKMGTYRIHGAGEPLVESNPQPFPKRGNSFEMNRDVRESQSISISFEGNLSLGDYPSYSNHFVSNTTDKTHILFFAITGHHKKIPDQQQRFVVSIILSPRHNKLVPIDLLRQSWEDAYFAKHSKRAPDDVPLKLFTIMDTTL